jgi:hypothetical protein
VTTRRTRLAITTLCSALVLAVSVMPGGILGVALAAKLPDAAPGPKSSRFT